MLLLLSLLTISGINFCYYFHHYCQSCLFLVLRAFTFSFHNAKAGVMDDGDDEGKVLMKMAAVPRLKFRAV